MIQQDYILRLAQQVAQVLAKMLGKNWVDVMPDIEEVYNNLLPVDRATIIALAPDEIIPFLVKEKELDFPYLEALADLLYFEGMQHHKEHRPLESQDRLHKAQHLFHHLDQAQGVFSFDRQEKQRSIRSILN